MKTRLIRIGDSRGVRIPKPLLQQSGLEDEVRLRVVDGAIVIEAARAPRAGWAEAAADAHGRGDDRLLEEPSPTRFDDSEWADASVPDWDACTPPPCPPPSRC